MGSIGGYRPGLIRRRGVAAALLNASGTGAGYLYLRLRARACACWAGTALLILAANAWNAAGAPLLWLPLYALWLAAQVADGYRRARHLPVPDPAAPTGRPWVPFAAGGALLVLVASGLAWYRTLPAEALERAERAHAARECADALAHYARASASRYEFVLSPASADARTGRDACAVALDAEASAERGDYRGAVSGYESYLALYDGAPPWPGAEQRLGQVRLLAADALAEAAAGHAAEDLGAAYGAAVAAYTAVRAQHPGTAEAARVPGRLDALYAAGTADLAERPCETVADLRALEDLAAVESDEAERLASRARSDLPGAQFACGEARFAEGAYCEAGDAFEAVLALAAATPERLTEAEESVGRSLYECGVAHYDAERYGQARDALERLVDGYPDDGRASVAEDLLIAVEIREVNEGRTGELPEPTPVGTAPRGAVTVEVVNDSPEALEILWTGPETGTATLDACADCTTRGELDGVFGQACGTDAERPAKTLTLAPGAYELVIRTTTGAFLSPHSGAWHLSAGTAYEDCYALGSDAP
ncbi:hypothetical protein [Streptomyces sp. PT12]|uniref:hypothetical protein n=1 Tax=Streptomyces sp. PT12 TaxID=1510197 RepID=UPI000DE3D9EE|nr:hypothetical protein [Streptomyces sp. PT12]RBM04531.1 hypothetical protein DEH69_30680 [Streptomyces sp. PT12]